MAAELVVELVASAVLKLSLPFSKLITLPQISVFMLGLIFTYFALESMVRTIYPCWSNTPSYYSLPFKGEGYIEGGVVTQARDSGAHLTWGQSYEK